ncbi:MAG: transporter substrate-binding domain-containing protein, partial [Lysobacter sp.]
MSTSATIAGSNAPAARTEAPQDAGAPPQSEPVVPPLRARGAQPALPRLVRMGVADWDLLPFDDYNDGQSRGFSVELIQEILKSHDIRLQFVRISDTRQMLEALCDGRLDLAPNLRLTPARTRCLAYSDPIMPVSMYAVKRKDDTRALTETNLKRMRVAIVAGLVEYTHSSDHMPQTALVPVQGTREALRSIEEGKADVYFEAPQVIDWYLHVGEHPNLQLVPSTQIPRQPSGLDVAYAAPHAQLPLLKMIDEEIKRDPARVERLRKQWFHGDFEGDEHSTELSSTQRQWLATLPKLRMTMSDNSAPLSSRDSDGSAVGILPDYARIVEERLGIEFQRTIGNGAKGVSIDLATGAADLALLPVGAMPGDNWIYSEPVERIPVAVVTAQGANSSVGMERLGGKRVSVTLLHLNGRAVLKASPQANVIAVATNAEGLKLLVAGKVDAHVGNLAIVDRIINTRYRSNELQIAPAGLTEEVAFVADRRLAPLIAIIDQQLETVSEAERQRIHNHWISSEYNYGVPWNKVVAILAISVLVIGAIAAGYLRLRQESRRREAADSKLREVANNLPGVVFKAQPGTDGHLRFPYLTGSPELLFGIDAERMVADDRALFWR